MAIIKSKICKGEYYNILVDDEDLQRVIDFAPNGWEVKYSRCGKKPYALTRKTVLIDGVKKRKNFLLHRVVMNVSDSKTPIIDHIENAETLDNRKQNLRPVTNAQNMKNRTSKKNGSCKHLGVYFCRTKLDDKKFRVNISDSQLKNHNIHLGYYLNEDSAGYAYNLAAAKIHGDFANPNKINMNLVINSIDIQKFIETKLNIFL